MGSNPAVLTTRWGRKLTVYVGPLGFVQSIHDAGHLADLLGSTLIISHE